MHCKQPSLLNILKGPYSAALDSICLIFSFLKMVRKRMFLEVQPDLPVGFFMTEKSTVVKKALLKSLRRDLDHTTKEEFIKYIKVCSELQACLCRRASLIFLYYVTKLLEQEKEIPDFMEYSQTWHMNWLKIGMKCFGNPMPSGVQQDYIDEVIFSVEELVETKYLPWGISIPQGFHGILQYAAIQFKTNLLNTLKTHFYDKIKRACRLFAVKKWTCCLSWFSVDQVTGYQVYNGIL